MSVKYRIAIGNCGNDINSDVVVLPPVPKSVTWDSTKVRFDSTIITFDHT